MAMDVTSYKCPVCKGTLKFDASTKRIVCEYCDSSFSVADIEQHYTINNSEMLQGIDGQQMNGYGTDPYGTNGQQMGGYANDPYAVNGQQMGGYANDPYAVNGQQMGGYANDPYAVNGQQMGGYVNDPYAMNGYGIGNSSNISRTSATGSYIRAGVNSGEQWNMSGMTSDWGTDANQIKAYKCSVCGAELIGDATTAVVTCPYCDNSMILAEKFQGTMRPDCIIPFKIKKEDAIAALKKHYENKPFLPNSFCEENHIQEIKGVYVPFWLFSGQIEGEMNFSATKAKSRTEGEYTVTDTEYYDVYRSGNLAFERIPVDGSTKIEDKYMDSIEPFQYGELVPFSMTYLAGYMAEQCDISSEEICTRAEKRAQDTMAEALKKTVVGYNSVEEKNRNLVLYRGEVNYALLPVWLLNTNWNGKNYLFAMNGQTGKLVGDLPVDKKKKRLTFAATFGVIIIVLLIIMKLFGWF